MCLAVTASVVLVACGDSKDEGSASTEKGPIVIGQAVAATGFMEPYDTSLKLGAKMAADDINAKGGVLGRQITFKSSDTKSDATRAGQAASKLLNDGADFLMSTCDYDLGAPIAQAGEKAGVVTAGCAGALQWGAQGLGPLTYNFFPGSATEGRIMSDTAEKKGFKKPFVLTLGDYAYTKTMCEYFNKSWKDTGNSVAGADTLKDSDAAIDTQISNIRSKSDADSIILCSFPPSGASAVKQIRAAGIDLPLVLAADFDGDYWLKSIPKLSDAYYAPLGSIFGDDPNPRHQELFDRIKEDTGKRAELSAYPLMGYSMVEAIAKAIEEAGDTDGKKVAEALDKFKDVNLMSGETTYTPDCHIPQTLPHVAMEIQNGKTKATGEIIKPTADPEAPC
jgi:branched-chain amino acid transport system substrate-binding protein